jgi:hypothetical protein
MTELTQKQRMAAELIRISADVTSIDRQEFMEQSGLTKGTVSLYLNGNVYNSDTAAQMISFFKEKIASRDLLIQKN